MTPLINQISFNIKSDQPNYQLVKLGSDFHRFSKIHMYYKDKDCSKKKFMMKTTESIEEIEEDFIGLEMQSDLLFILAKLCSINIEG